MRLHLLDGTYELFRSYFGAPKRADPDGREIGAVHGIMLSTLALLAEGVTHLAVAFDTVIRSFRNDLYDGYKSEAGVPADLLAQFPIAEEGLEAMGVTVWRMVEYEADDALASAVERFGPEFEQVVIMSPDKDLTQCIVGNRVVGFDRRKGAFIDEAGVVAKFGVPPESIPDYLGLVGDSSDGFPGVPGWGAKSASMVLAAYRHIERIPLEASLWSPQVRGAERLVGSPAGAHGRRARCSGSSPSSATTCRSRSRRPTSCGGGACPGGSSRTSASDTGSIPWSAARRCGSSRSHEF